MFRLVNFDEDSKLYKYLSGIASESIYNALDSWMSDDSDIKALYENEFEDFDGSEIVIGDGTDMPDEPPVNGFFEGVSDFFQGDLADRWKVIDERIIDEDGRIGMEMISRKISRMKEKMADPDHYYTFDLFEEYLFYLMTEFYQMSTVAEMFDEEGIDMDDLDDETEIEIEMEYETEDEDIIEVIETLINDYGLEEEEALSMTYPLFRPELMGLDAEEEESLFFWDLDFLMFFQNGFISGIRRMISGIGSALGYHYSNVTEIFTDIDFKAPITLVGTETAYNLRGQAIINYSPDDI